MNGSNFCEQCGAALVAGAQFCETCGKPVASTTQPMPPPQSRLVPAVSAEPAAGSLSAPSAIAPRGSNRRPLLILSLVGVVVVSGCLVVAAIGYWFMRNQSTAPGQISSNTPQFSSASTRVPPTNIASPITAAPPPTAPPLLVPATPSRIPVPPSITATTKPSPVPVAIPSVCWFTLDDLRSLPGLPTDYEQQEGVTEWWDVPNPTIERYGSYTTILNSYGWVGVSCIQSDYKPTLDTRIPTNYTAVEIPKIGDGSFAYRGTTRLVIRYIKGNSIVTVSFPSTAIWGTPENLTKLANILAARIPAGSNLKPPSRLPQIVNENGFSKLFNKFELGAGDPFVAGTSFELDLPYYASVGTLDPLQRYSLWVTDAKQNVLSVETGISGTRIFMIDSVLDAGVYTAHLEIAGVIYARRVFTVK